MRSDFCACICSAGSDFERSFFIYGPLDVSLVGAVFSDRLKDFCGGGSGVSGGEIKACHYGAEGDGGVAHEKFFVHVFCSFVTHCYKYSHFWME